MVPDPRKRTLDVDIASYQCVPAKDTISLVTSLLMVGSSATGFRLCVPRTLREPKLSQSTPFPQRYGGGR